jgi:hypothetical protein
MKNIVWNFNKPESRPPVSDPQDYDKDALPYKLHKDEKSLPRKRKPGENPTS